MLKDGNTGWEETSFKRTEKVYVGDYTNNISLNCK